MPENTETEPPKTKTSKKHLIATIIRWLFAVFLIALLGYCLYCRAVWKINVILIILIAGLIVLPHKLRNFFYVVISIILICAVIWVLLPDDNEDWRPYAFDEEVALLNAKYYVPDQENAAVIYNQLPVIFDDPCTAYIFEDSNTFYKLSGEPWSADDYSEYSKWLDNHQEIIDLLLQVTQYERYYRDTKVDVITDASHYMLLSPTRRAAQLLALAANYDIGQKKYDESLAKYNAVMHIGDHFQQNPTTLHKLVGIAIEALAIDRLQQFIIEQSVTLEQIKQAETITYKADFSWKKHLPQIIEYETLYQKNFAANYYEINSRGRTRFTRDPWRSRREHYQKLLETDTAEYEEKKECYESAAHPSYWKKKLWKANMLLLWFTFPSNPQAAGQIIDNEYQSYYDVLNPDYNWQKEPDGPPRFSDMFTFTHLQLNFNYYAKNMVKILEPPFRQLRYLYLRIGADKRGTLLLAALKRYKNKTGSWPDNISQIEQFTNRENLIDPLSNGPFIYKLAKNGFLLYSIGLNGIDEYGKREKLDCSQTTDSGEYKKINIGADDWLIWPPKLNSNDEEGDGPNDE